MKSRQTIGNVVNLDIRTATEASVASIKSIGNVVNLLYSPETAGLLAQLHIGNIVNRIEAPAAAKVHHGHLVLNRDTFAQRTEPLSMVVFGQVTVERDVSSRDIEDGLEYLGVLGQVLCPEHLAGALQAKLCHISGPMHVYPRDAKLVARSLTLDDHVLRSLDDGSVLMVTGRLNASKVLSNDLLERKIGKIQVTDGVICREENAETLLPRLEHKSGGARVTVIPAGYELVERPLVLSLAVLNALPSRKLYCTELVRIEREVDTDTLDKALEALVAKDMLLCPAALSSVLSEKVNILETDVIFYEGQLWLVEQKSSLVAARFDHLDEGATLVVLGALTIAPEVEPKTLVDRLVQVHNFGFIQGTPEQIAALQFRLRTDEGELMSISPTIEEGAKAPPVKAHKDEHAIASIVNLRL